MVYTLVTHVLFRKGSAWLILFRKNCPDGVSVTQKHACKSKRECASAGYYGHGNIGNIKEGLMGKYSHNMTVS